MHGAQSPTTEIHKAPRERPGRSGITILSGQIGQQSVSNQRPLVRSRHVRPYSIALWSQRGNSDRLHVERPTTANCRPSVRTPLLGAAPRTPAYDIFVSSLRVPSSLTTWVPAASNFRAPTSARPNLRRTRNPPSGWVGERRGGLAAR